MNYNRLSLIIILVIIILLPQTIANHSNLSETSKSNIPNNYLIEGVPYIAQTQGYFCGYSCRAMILNHLGFETTLEDILFYDGLGYTHFYQYHEKLPEEGRYSDLNHVINLFGIEQNWSYLDPSNWDIYFNNLKENISNDMPVITRVDPFSMPSLRNQFKVNDFLWEKMFPPSRHLIVIIGYNEENHSICYNDPNAGFYGEGSYGDHAWIDIEEYKKAVLTNSNGNILYSTIKVIKNPVTKQDRFEFTFKQNIVKLQGEYSEYHHFTHRPHGIIASKKMKNDLFEGENNRSETIEMYKKYGDTGFNFTFIELLHKLYSILTPKTPSVFDIYIIGYENHFESIANEKQIIAYYLEKSNIYQELCKNQSNLLREESELWEQMSNYYKIFLKKGIRISDLRAGFILQGMEKTINKIIQIEQRIIDEGCQYIFS